MEENNTQLKLTANDSELVLDEAPASVAMLIGGDSEKAERIAAHRLQMASIRKQYPHPSHPYKIGVYIRYFNQTKHENYLEKHIAHFKEAIDLCRTLVDFYIDEGQTAPNMENAPEWKRLIDDCFTGIVNYSFFKTDASFEIYSKQLVSTLMSLLPKLEKDCTYRLTGEVRPNEKIAFFSLDTMMRVEGGN